MAERIERGGQMSDGPEASMAEDRGRKRGREAGVSFHGRGGKKVVGRWEKWWRNRRGEEKSVVRAEGGERRNTYPVSFTLWLQLIRNRLSFERFSIDRLREGGPQREWATARGFTLVPAHP